MFQRSAVPILFTVLFLWIPLGNAQQSGDWRKHYGLPAAERYAIRDGITMTAFYSEEGLTCKAMIESVKPQSAASIEEILNEIIPVNERGKRMNSVALTSGPVAGVASRDYERVRVAVVTSVEVMSQGATTGGVISATVDWKGVQCRLPDRKM